jgi:LemA protein
VHARNAAITAPGSEQKIAAEHMLTSALRQLFAVAEAYPDLKASENFEQLQMELAGIENKLAASRRFFNKCGPRVQHRYSAVPGVLVLIHGRFPS